MGGGGGVGGGGEGALEGTSGGSRPKKLGPPKEV